MAGMGVQYQPLSGMPSYGGWSPGMGSMNPIMAMMTQFLAPMLGIPPYMLSTGRSPVEQYMGFSMQMQRQIAMGGGIKSLGYDLATNMFPASTPFMNALMPGAAMGSGLYNAARSGYGNMMGINGVGLNNVGAQMQASMTRGSFVGAGDVGQLVGTMAQYGNPMAGRIGAISSMADTEAALKKFSGEIKSMTRDFQQLATVLKLNNTTIQQMNQYTQGGITHLGVKGMTQLGMQMQSLQYATGMPMEQIGNMMGQGAAMARQLGMVPTVGARAAIYGASMGYAMNAAEVQGGQYFGMRSPEELTGVMQQRMILGAGSAMAQRGGGFAAAIMQQAQARGLYRSGMGLGAMARALGANATVTGLASDIEAGRGSAVAEQLSTVNMGNVVRAMGSIGLSESVAYTSLTNRTRASQEMIDKYMTKMTPELQNEQLFKRIGASVQGTLAGMGIRGRRAGRIAQQAMAAMQTEGAYTNARVGVAAIQRATGVSGRVAENVWNQMYQQGEQYGGVETIFGAAAARAQERRVRGFYNNIVNANMQISEQSGRGMLSNLMSVIGGGGKKPTDQVLKEVFTGVSDEKRKEIMNFFGKVQEHGQLGRKLASGAKMSPKEREEAMAKFKTLEGSITAGLKNLSGDKNFEDKFGIKTLESLSTAVTDAQKAADETTTMNAKEVIIKTDKSVNIDTKTESKSTREETWYVDGGTGAGQGSSSGSSNSK
jgi:hypothetical protein